PIIFDVPRPVNDGAPGDTDAPGQASPPLINKLHAKLFRGGRILKATVLTRPHALYNKIVNGDGSFLGFANQEPSPLAYWPIVLLFFAFFFTRPPFQSGAPGPERVRPSLFYFWQAGTAP